MSGAVASMLGNAGASGVLASTLPSSSFAASNDWQLKNDGTFVSAGATGQNWVTPANASVAALYQAKTTVTAGAFSADPSAGVYIDLSTSRNWQKSVAGSVTFNLSIREKATGIVRATYTGITLTTT